MRVIIAGSRKIESFDVFEQAIKTMMKRDMKITTIVSGGARGIDTLAKDLAEVSEGVEYDEYPANWDKYGRAAGPIRNEEMAANADALIVIWDGKSSGSKDMINKARDRGLDIFQFICSKDENDKWQIDEELFCK